MEIIENEAQSDDLVSDIKELYTFLHYLCIFWLIYYYMIWYSVGALPLEEVADASKGEIKAEDGENNEYGKDDSGADHLSIMYPPCQDPLLFKMYRGLPALPYVFLYV